MAQKMAQKGEIGFLKTFWTNQYDHFYNPLAPGLCGRGFTGLRNR